MVIFVGQLRDDLPPPRLDEHPRPADRLLRCDQPRDVAGARAIELLRLLLHGHPTSASATAHRHHQHRSATLPRLPL